MIDDDDLLRINFAKFPTFEGVFSGLYCVVWDKTDPSVVRVIDCTPLSNATYSTSNKLIYSVCVQCCTERQISHDLIISNHILPEYGQDNCLLIVCVCAWFVSSAAIGFNYLCKAVCDWFCASGAVSDWARRCCAAPAYSSTAH